MNVREKMNVDGAVTGARGPGTKVKIIGNGVGTGTTPSALVGVH